ncbi:TetR family transcriptional regulator C-terminal domain-containing protein [Pseudonocardia sp. NPDC049154]|uniref:TetR family transcriptional regulator C-terminal domain-containing protein n=1 Tax=Pseudonocardia sp. NPDC049154 TaxID=3155501 RepID=UPI0033D7C74E
MPRRIDADVRRREIAALAASLVARRGTDGLSLRALAAAAGASTTVITHYFAGKKELLQSAYHAAVDQARDRVREAPGEDDPRRLVALCEAVLPLDAPRSENWRTWLAFFGIAVGEPDLGAVQRRRVTGHRDLIADAVRAGQRLGTVDAARDPDEEARTLLALTHGVAVEAAFDPEDWPAARQRALVARHVATLAHPPSREDSPAAPARESS